MKTLDKQNLQVLKNDILNALNDVAKKHGLAGIDIVSGSYSPSQYTARISFRTLAQEQDPFIQGKLSRLGLPSDSIGRQFVSLGQTFQIARIDTKKPKFPVIAKLVVGGTVTEKSFKFQAASAKRLLEKYAG
jgi:hypothetical protein